MKEKGRRDKRWRRGLTGKNRVRGSGKSKEGKE